MGYWGGDIRWVTPADLSKLDGHYISDTPRTLTPSGLASCSATVLPAGSVLLSSRAPIGHVAITTKPMATNQGFKSLVPHADVLDAKYLYHWLNFKKEYLQSIGNGATFKELSKATVARVEIPLPPIKEQRRIAAILDQADALRTKRHQVLAHLDTLGQSIFSAIFGDPGMNIRGLPSRALSDWIDPERPITYGILMPGPEVIKGVPYVRVADIQNGGINLKTVRRTSASIAADYSRSTLRTGDLLMSIRGHVGRFAFVPNDLAGGNITQDSARLAVKDPESAIYVRAAMESPAAQYWMARRTKGAAVKGINLGDLRVLPLLVPATSDIQQFAATMRNFETQRRNSLATETPVGELFASLQSRAFQGEL
jgi:type I restriction enzyme S subunit